MFAFVIATFLICWLPYHAYFLYSYHNPEVELPILSVYSLVFVILFVTNNLHHPGPPTAPLCLLLPQLWGGAVFLIWWFIKRIFYSYQTIFITYRCFSPVMSWCHGIGFVISMLDIFYTTNVNASFSAISKSKTSSKCSPYICPIPSNLRCTCRLWDLHTSRMPSCSSIGWPWWASSSILHITFWRFFNLREVYYLLLSTKKR